MNVENHGNRNLLILGIGAFLIATLTTCLSLWAYRTSGDIYLDRSRPGYLPDKDEAGEESEVAGNYTFSENGELNQTELAEYLKELKVIIDRIESLSDPYAPNALSDESLGIKKLPDAPETPAEAK